MAVLLIAGCGIFTPREIAVVPRVDTGTSDPFRFRILLEGTGEMFEPGTWQDFFHTDCHYSNINLGSIDYNRSDLVNHLEQELQLHPAITVTWQTTQSFSRDADRIVINNVRYSVLDSTAADPVLGEGSCDFEIIRDAGSSAWQIRLWKDLSSKSIFSP